MPWSFIIPAAASLIGGSMQSSAAKSAANTSAAAANRAADLQYKMFQEQTKLQEPYRKAGVNALGKLQTAAEYTPFGMSQFQADPGYAFRLGEGQKALERSAAARGGLISGGALKAATRYGQEAGSQEYTNAFNRYQTERQAKLGPLQSLAGVGQTAVNQLGAAGQSYATGAGEAIGAGAQARASGYMGGASALSQGLGQYLNYSQGQQRNALLQKAIGGGGGGGMSEPYPGYNAAIGIS